jgi:hypothetical protein
MHFIDIRLEVKKPNERLARQQMYYIKKNIPIFSFQSKQENKYWNS